MVTFNCAVCDKEFDDEGEPIDVFGESGSLDDYDGWYIHVHEFSNNLSAPRSEFYAFCPDHHPKATFPMANQNPQFDPEVEVERLKDKYL